MGIIKKVKEFLKVPFKTRIIRDYGSRWFEFFNKDLATNETIFSAVSMLSNAIASAPISVQSNYRKLKPSENNLAKLFKYGVNPRMSTFNFMKTMEVNRCTKGAAYAIKEYGYAGEIISLWVLKSEYVNPIIEKDSNELYYEVRDADGVKYIHSDHIIAVQYLTTDGFSPINPLDVLKNTIDYDREIKEFTLNQMQKGLKANLVVKIQTKLGQENLEEYNKMMSNMMKNGVIYVDQGKDFQELKNTSYIDPNVAITEQITVERVERVYNMIGKLTKGSSTNTSATDTEDLLYLKDALLPPIRLYEQEFTRKLLGEHERDELGEEIKLSMNGFARATMEKRGNYYQQMIRNGLMTQNEIRAYEDLPPVEGGDVLFVSRDMCPSDMIRELIGNSKNNTVKKS